SIMFALFIPNVMEWWRYTENKEEYYKIAGWLARFTKFILLLVFGFAPIMLWTAFPGGEGVVVSHVIVDVLFKSIPVILMAPGIAKYAEMSWRPWTWVRTKNAYAWTLTLFQRKGAIEPETEPMETVI
ncbi:unnamed protein product, partial [marine sediment metagenome]